jgi:hypothetical protein
MGTMDPLQLFGNTCNEYDVTVSTFWEYRQQERWNCYNFLGGR